MKSQIVSKGWLRLEAFEEPLCKIFHVNVCIVCKMTRVFGQFYHFTNKTHFITHVLPTFLLSRPFQKHQKKKKKKEKFSPGSLELVTAPLNDLPPASPRWAWPWPVAELRAESERNPAGPRDFGRRRRVGPRH